MTDTHCTRCNRPVNELSREFVEWEAGPDGSVVCPGCLTGEEQAAIDADALDMTSKAAIEEADREAGGEGMADALDMTAIEGMLGDDQDGGEE
jgi:uncharacterized Zn finger protein (UPF0148 family)